MKFVFALIMAVSLAAVCMALPTNTSLVNNDKHELGFGNVNTDDGCDVLWCPPECCDASTCTCDLRIPCGPTYDYDTCDERRGCQCIDAWTCKCP